MKTYNEMQQEIILKNKNGVNFLVAASIIWAIIGVLWLLPYNDGWKAMFTFSSVALLMPLAFAFSKVFQTSWNIENNPLNKAGLWLNFAQLFYFPFVFFFLGQNRASMPLALAIITGAHFFPFGWFYQTKGYAVMAGVIVLGNVLIWKFVPFFPTSMLAFYTAVCIMALAWWIYADYKKVVNAAPKFD